TANIVAGNYTVTATASGGSNPSAAFSLTNRPGAPATLTVFAGNNQTATVTTAFRTEERRVGKDRMSSGTPDVGVTCTPHGSGPSGTFAGSATVATDVNGSATAPTLTANTVAGAYTVTATASGGSNPSAAFSLTNRPGAPATLTVFAGNNQTATVTTAF